MAEQEVLLRATRITKSFPEGRGASRSVLDGLNLEIHRQSLVVIRGESGSGKSTLLRILGLVDTDFEGEVEIGGEQVGGKGPRLSEAQLEDLRSRRIGFVFQDDLLLPLLTLRENAELPARIHRLPKPRIRKRLGALQKLIFRTQELAEGVLKRRRTSVSGGQRQRAAILRALSHGPDLILADEPTASLDPLVKAEVVKLFQQLCRAGATILVTSHDAIFRNVGENYVLQQGKLLPGSDPEILDQTLANERRKNLTEVPVDGVKPESFYSQVYGRVGKRHRLLRGCPPGLQAKIALREALGNPLFAFMIVAAMAAGLFQLTLLWSIRNGTETVLDDVINQGSRLDRVEVSAKAQDVSGQTEIDGGNTDGLPTPETIASVGDHRNTVKRREIVLRIKDSRGRERQETTFGLIADDPELRKLEIREGQPFEDQEALAVLITQRSVERFFGASAVNEDTTGKSLPIHIRRYVRPTGADATTERVKEELELPFVVQGVVDRAEAGRNLYLPQATLMAIATWQVDSTARIQTQGGRLELERGRGGDDPTWDRLHVYFDRLDEVLPAAEFLERRGYSTRADLFRYKWILDTRRFVNWMLGGIIAMVMGIAGLLIMSNVVSGVRMKRKEISVLKLMGMKNSDVVVIFVLSVLLCALAGGLLGFGGGSAAVDWLRGFLTEAYPDSPLSQVLTSTWAQIGYALLLCFVVTIAFTVWPAWRTARKEAVWKLD